MRQRLVDLRAERLAGRVLQLQEVICAGDHLHRVALDRESAGRARLRERRFERLRQERLDLLVGLLRL